MNAKDAIFSRIESAQKSAPPTIAYASIPRNYERSPMLPPNPNYLVKQMRQALLDYGAEVFDCDSQAELPDVIAQVATNLQSVVISGDAPIEWIKSLMKRHLVYLDSATDPLSNQTLDQVDGAVTSSRLGIAPTGTIVLDAAPGQGRRKITLLPDTHIVVLYTDTICATVPQAFEILEKHPNRPQTWISGPSATSDIELSRVDGVHGPRNLKVILAKRTKVTSPISK